MNKKAENDLNIGGLIIVAIAAIVGIILLTASAQNVGEVTNTFAVANASLGVSDNATTVYLTNFRAISSAVINNNSAVVVPSTNYTVTNNVIDPTTGGLSVSVLPSATAAYEGYQWNISGTAQPTTYDTSSGGRAVAGLIIVFFAIAIAIVMLIPTLRSKILESMNR